MALGIPVDVGRQTFGFNLWQTLSSVLFLSISLFVFMSAFA